ncbi:MAG: stage V sporulation protein AA [Defluviitaleaceae bacterium]|nr:stage V sporulation protein AA [Defluviitaleaceae bacterium]
MTIYIKPKKKAILADKFQILIKDVADVVAKGDEGEKIGQLKLVTIKHDAEKTKNYAISVTDIIKKITQAYPNAAVNNVGELDTWVHCTFGKAKDKPLFMWLRVCVVSLILMVGAATAIMAFHTDGQIPKVFERYYSMLYGTESKNPPIIAIPYCIGLALGIVVFYNHFMGKKISDDPTPIEVEIEQYNTQVTEAVIEMIEKQEQQNA